MSITATKPNILFVMGDHANNESLRPGSPCLKPNFDRVAAAGTRFHRCYTSNAVCSPARASLMTGLYPSAHGVWDCTHVRPKTWVDLPAKRFPVFPEILAGAGYYNAYFGKWHVDQSSKLEDFGWHEYDTSCSSAPRNIAPGTEFFLRGPDGYRDFLMCGVNRGEGTPAAHPAYDKAENFIRRHVAENRAPDGTLKQPFCCFVSTDEPHDPYIPLKRFLDDYDIQGIPLSPSLRDPPDGKPDVVRRMRRVWDGVSDNDWRMLRASYWAVMSFLDNEFGRLLNALRETGQDENTIIVFTSDHGDMLGAHGLGTKGFGTSY